jgi:hypothetical protein
MSRLPALFLIIFLFIGPAHAMRFAPYLGAALQYQMIAWAGGSWAFDDLGNQKPYISIAGEYEAGITAPSYSVYAAYHQFPLIHMINLGNDDTWDEARYLFGARWHMNSGHHFRVQPTVGAALSYGRVHMDRYYYDYSVWQGKRYSKWSEARYGLMLEMGFLIHTFKAIDINVLCRTEVYTARFLGDPVNNESVQYHLISPSLQVGARYVFPTLTISR